MRISDWSSDVCSSDLSRPAQCGDAVPDTAKPDSLWHRDCHKGKTASDRVRMAKVDRLRKAHLDLKKRKGRKLQSRSLPTRLYQTAHVPGERMEEHTSEVQSLMRKQSAVFCVKK